MKGLTIRQPWAGLIAAGVKTVEFRKHRAVSMIGERFAVHAASRHIGCATCPVALKHCDPDWPRCEPGDPDAPLHEYARSAVVAIATLTECRRVSIGDHEQPGFPHETVMSDKSAPQWWAWLLSDVQALPEPVPCRGRQGWWNLPAEVEAEVLRQLEETVDSTGGEKV